MNVAPEKSKEIKAEIAKEKPPVRLYILTGCRIEKTTGDMYVATMLYNTPALTKFKYREVRKYKKSQYEGIINDFRERMKDTPAVRKILESDKRAYHVWQGYFCALVGSQVLLNIQNDLELSGVEQIDWVVYGRSGKLICAYLDRFFDLSYEKDSYDGIGAGSCYRHARYYSHSEEIFAENQMEGVLNNFKQLAEHYEIGVRLGAYTGLHAIDESEPFDSPKVKQFGKVRALELKGKTAAQCVESKLGVSHAGAV